MVFNSFALDPDETIPTNAIRRKIDDCPTCSTAFSVWVTEIISTNTVQQYTSCHSSCQGDARG